MDDDDEKDQFYGCGCQRYLALGILLPVILLVSALGVIGFAVLLLGKLFIFYEGLVSF